MGNNEFAESPHLVVIMGNILQVGQVTKVGRESASGTLTPLLPS
jgi:hypothetical protein